MCCRFPSDPPKGKGGRVSEASGLVASAALPMLRAIRAYRERYTGQLLEATGDGDHESGYDGGSDAGGVKPTAINRLVRNLTLKVGGRSGRREGADSGVAGGVQAVAARNKSFAAASFTVVGAGSMSSARTGASESAMRPVFES